MYVGAGVPVYHMSCHSFTIWIPAEGQSCFVGGSDSHSEKQTFQRGGIAVGGLLLIIPWDVSKFARLVR